MVIDKMANGISVLVFINFIITLFIRFKFRNSFKLFEFEVSLFVGSFVPLLLYIGKITGLTTGIDIDYFAVSVMTGFRMTSIFIGLAEDIISSEDTKMIRINEIIFKAMDFIGVMCGIFTISILIYSFVSNL